MSSAFHLFLFMILSFARGCIIRVCVAGRTTISVHSDQTLDGDVEALFLGRKPTEESWRPGSCVPGQVVQHTRITEFKSGIKRGHGGTRLRRDDI